MVKVSYQRRMARQILKCGSDRVWIDPDQLDEVAEAVTRGDIRRLICYRVIQVRQKQGVSRGRTRMTTAQKAKGRRSGPGSRRGRKYARAPRKRNWIRIIRPLRDELKTLREEGKLDRTTYRIYYRKSRGNMFKSRAHLLSHLQAAGVLTEADTKHKESAKQRARREREEHLARAQAARARVRQKAADARVAREAERKAAEEAAMKEAGAEEGDEPKEGDEPDEADEPNEADGPQEAEDAPGDDDGEEV